MKILNKTKQFFIGMAVMVGIAMSIVTFSPEKEPMAFAQEGSCPLGEITVNVEVLCWTVDAVNFVIDNELFSILSQEDLRDAVKHYRFYQLVISELNQ